MSSLETFCWTQQEEFSRRKSWKERIILEGKGGLGFRLDENMLFNMRLQNTVRRTLMTSSGQWLLWTQELEEWHSSSSWICEKCKKQITFHQMYYACFFFKCTLVMNMMIFMTLDAYDIMILNVITFMQLNHSYKDNILNLLS